VSAPVVVSREQDPAGGTFRRHGQQYLALFDTHSVRAGRGGRLTLTARRTERQRAAGTGAWQERRVTGIPLTLQPVLVGASRGKAAGEVPPTLAADGSLQWATGRSRLGLRASAAGARLTWLLPRAPAGQGPLTLQLKVSGLPHAGVTDGGLHFLAALDQLGVRLGPATLVARGATAPTALGATFARGKVTVRVPAALLARAAYPARVSLQISPEQGIDRPLQGPADANEESAAVASDGRGYLVVWRDGRAGSRNEIHGARVSASGRVLDPEGIPIRAAAASCDRPHVAWGRGVYLAVWEEHRGATGFDIVGARVSRAGTVLDPDGVVISRAAHGQSRPRVAFDGERFWVVWEDRRSGRRYDIYGARVEASGKVMDLGGIAVSAAPGHQKSPALCAGRQGALVVWDDLRSRRSRDIYAARVDATGAVSQPDGVVVADGPSSQRAPVMGCGEAQALVLWEDDASGAGAELRGARLGWDGAVGRGAGFVVAAGLADQQGAALALHRDGFMVLWSGRRQGELTDVRRSLVKVRDDGVEVVAPAGQETAGGRGRQQGVAVAAGPGGFLTVWQDRRHGRSFDLFGRRLSAAGAPVGRQAMEISSPAGVLVRGALARAGGGHLAVWRDYRGDSRGAIFAAQVEARGALPGVEAAGGRALLPAPGAQARPAVASGGGVILVVWRDHGADPSGDILGLRLDARTGEAVDGAALPIGPGPHAAGAPAVAYDGERFMVAWSSDGAVVAARVPAAGAAGAGRALPISAPGRRAAAPAVAGAAGQFLVAWQGHGRDRLGDIMAARVGGDGAVTPAGGGPVSRSPGAQRWPAVCAAGEQFWVAWQDERPAARGADIYGARVRASDGWVLDPAGIPLGVAPGAQQSPALAFDGGRLLVAWHDLRRGQGADIVGTLVDGAGEVVHPRGVALGADGAVALHPALSVERSGRFLVAYHLLGEAGATLQVRTVDWGAATSPR